MAFSTSTKKRKKMLNGGESCWDLVKGGNFFERLLQNDLNWFVLLLLIFDGVKSHRCNALTILILLLCCLSSSLGLSSLWIILTWSLCEGYQVYEIGKQLVYLHLFALHPDQHEDLDPAFLLDPDSETLGWFNLILNSLWVNCLRELLRRDLKNFINNKIFKKKIALLNLDIGSTCPWLSGVKTYTGQMYATDSYESIMVDIGFVVDLNPDINFSFKKLFFGLDTFKFNGILRLRFTPLLRDSKGFGQLHLSLRHLPKTDVNFTGILSCLNPLKPFLNWILNQGLNLIVSPRKAYISHVVQDQVSCHGLHPTAPIGMLKVTLKEGRNVQPKVVPLLCPCSPRGDPYCIVSIGTRRFRTPVVKKSLDPEWNFTQCFPLTDNDDQGEIKVRLMDWEWVAWKRSQELGFTTLNVKKLKNVQGICDQWYSLANAEQAKINIQTQFLPIISSAANEETSDEAILGIVLYSVKMSQQCQPMIVIEVSGRPTYASSCAGKSSFDWEFAEEFLLPIQSVDTDKVTIKLVDYDASRSIKKTTKRVIKFLRKLVADFQEPPLTDQVYRQDKHLLLAEKTFEMASFSGGQKQSVLLDSLEEGSFTLDLQGQLHYLHNS